MPGQFEMREKKYIDRLYQEKFKDFEASPSEAVWKSISAKLQEEEKVKKKPFIAPLWPRLGGIAALLTFFFLIGEWFLPADSSRIANEDVKDILKTTGPPEESAVATTKDQDEYSLFEKPDMREMLLPFGQQKSIVSETSSIKQSGVKKLPITSTRTPLTASEKQKVNEKGIADMNKRSLLDELVLDNNSEVTDIRRQSKIEVKTHAAPIYYGNFGKGNFLDPSFNNNSSQGEITYSYGLNISYAISDKIRIRSGVNKVAMSYNTSGVSYQAVINPKAISSISYVGRPSSNLENPTAKSDIIPNTTRANIGNINNSLLNQKMGFIEVPLEVEYSLINRKFELNLIGGASTLFLDENRISVDSGLSSTILGPANNINNISFSTNVGLGLDYNLSEKFKLNLEPMFKYQINTFNQESTDNQPYYLGIYSGFSFKF